MVEQCLQLQKVSKNIQNPPRKAIVEAIKVKVKAAVTSVNLKMV